MRRTVVSKKEFQVLIGLCEDLPFEEIGQRLGITSSTARTHARTLYKKLRVHTNREAITRAWRLGVLQTCPTCRRPQEVPGLEEQVQDVQALFEGEGVEEVELERGLAARQQQVLELLAIGYSTEQIAKKLFLTSNTIRTNLKNLYRNLGVHERAHAVAIGFAEGYLTPEHVKGTNKPKE